MIHAHFGISRDPFTGQPELLAHQREILDILLVHCRQGGLCLVAGEPGTGKSVLAAALREHDPKGLLTPHFGRTLHTYHNTLRILCQAFAVDHHGGDHKCEKRLILEAFRRHKNGQAIALLIDDAHLMHPHNLRKLRLLAAEFPPSHNIILFAQTELLATLSLGVNEDLRGRLTYSVIIRKPDNDAIAAFILDQFDRCGLPHSAITEPALALIARSSSGILRHARNLTLHALVQTVRAGKRAADLPEVNAALMQPHWRSHDHWIGARNEDPK